MMPFRQSGSRSAATIAPSPTLAWRVVGDILVVVHADALPTDEDWRALIRTRNLHRSRLKGQLIIAPPRATIDAKQRADVKTFLQQTGALLVVLTDSRLARGAALAVAWFGLPVHALPRARMDDALSILGIAPSQRDELTAAAFALTLEVSPEARGHRRIG